MNRDVVRMRRAERGTLRRLGDPPELKFRLHDAPEQKFRLHDAPDVKFGLHDAGSEVRVA
jgi:hypothetical protein